MRSRLPGVVACIAIALTGCEGSQLVRDTFGQKLSEPTGDAIDPEMARRDILRKQLTAVPGSKRNQLAKEIAPEVQKGSGRFTSDRVGVERRTLADGREGITMNLVSVPIAHAAKAILGDVLQLNYLVDEKVQGTLTIQTSRPVSSEALTDIFEAGLKANGATLIQASGTYRIVPLSAAERTPRAISLGASGSGLGNSVRIVPLQYVSASEIGRILEPIAPQKAVLRLDNTRNLVMLNGSPEELGMMSELIAIFDVDWMKGLSFGLFPVKSSAPEEITGELENIFGSGQEGPLTGTLKFIPNRRLSAVLAISSRPAYLEKARDWIAKLDRQAERSEEQVFVYKIQNRPAEQLATLLSQILSEQRTGGKTGSIGPRFEPGMTATPQSGGTATGVTTSTSSPVRTTNLAGAGARIGDGAEVGSGLTDPFQRFAHTGGHPSSQQNLPHGTRIVADDANNAVLVYATSKEWDRVRRILERLDLVATQVLIEAVIAEVSLNDELKFGLRWHLEKGPSKFSLSDAASGVVSSVFPGFSYFFSTKEIQVVLNAVAGITDVRVVSAPSLMVADNRTAKLQVGDQVPIVTQTAQSVTNPDAPVVNAVTMKDTGVILAVTPRVADSGRVTLEIEQEVSSVARTTSSGIDSPTIQQRKIKTTVAVADGQVLALGGLIQQRENSTKSQIPLLGSLPVVGNAFRHKDDRIEKTELLIFIRPRVVRDDREAKNVTEEFRSQLELHAPRKPVAEPSLHRDLRRIAR